MKQNRLRAFLFSTLCLLSVQLFAQTFTEVTTSIQALFGSSDWGDCDSDGDLDLLISGSSSLDPLNAHINVYSNMGNGQFVFVVVPGLSGIYSGTAKWIDYNNDGILDIIASGMCYDTTWQQYLPATKLYKGKGNKVFELTDQDFESLSQTSIGWGDFNNDGKVDLALSGLMEISPHYRSKVYVNMADTFSEYPKYQIETFINGNMNWADYDGDQDIDLLITGWYYNFQTNQNDYGTNVYRNDGDSLTLLKNLTLEGTVFGSAEWGDYDNDGDLDILVSGSIGFGSSATGYLAIYQNIGNDTFTKIDFQEPSVIVFGKSKWGDMDNDGDLDIVVTGRTQQDSKGYTYLYKNNNSSFSQSTTVSDLFGSTLDLVDYDKDGDLDIFIMGISDYIIQTKLLKNTLNNTNLKPTAPSGLMAKAYKKEVQLCWSPSTDDHSLSKGLTYNIIVGSQPDVADVMEPNSDLATGFRKLVRIGNTSSDTCWKLNLNYGQYYWRVQAIDQSYLGSSFSETGSFSISYILVITEPATDIGNTSATLNGIVNPYSLNTSVFFEYGTNKFNTTKTTAVQLQGDSMFHVAFSVQGLIQDTIYQYRIVAINELDTVNGSFVSFRTSTDGIDEYFEDIALYPNPGNGIFNISIPHFLEGEILIFDQAGRILMQLNSKILKNSNCIDISHFESGVYVLILRTKKHTYRCMIEKI